jgi:putative endonuclease
MKQLNFIKGRFGEDRAKKFLIEMGMVYIESNFTIMNGEIDLIMSDNDTLVFIEVKYKNDNFMGLPEEMINRRKILQVKRVAEYFLLNNQYLKKHFNKYRIDAVCILGNIVKHYKNVYE